MKKNITPFLGIVILIFALSSLVEPHFSWWHIPKSILYAFCLCYIFGKIPRKDSAWFGDLEHYIAAGVITLILLGIGVLSYGRR